MAERLNTIEAVRKRGAKKGAGSNQLNFKTAYLLIKGQDLSIKEGASATPKLTSWYLAETAKESYWL